MAPAAAVGNAAAAEMDAAAPAAAGGAPASACIPGNPGPAHMLPQEDLVVLRKIDVALGHLVKGILFPLQVVFRRDAEVNNQRDGQAAPNGQNPFLRRHGVVDFRGALAVAPCA